MTAALNVWAGAPEVAALTAANAKVAHRLAELTSTAGRPMATAADLADTLAAGGDIPADLAQRLYDAAHADERTGLERETLLQTRTVLAERLRDARVHHADDALRYLHGVLVDDVIPQVREVAGRLRRVHDADEAVAAGLGDDWRALAHLDRAHRAIRVEQLRIVSEVLNDPHAASTLVDRAGRFRNVCDFAPWRDRIAHGRDDSRAPDVATAGAVTVTRHASADTPPSYSDGIDYTRWLASGEPEPWVPTVRELQAAADGIDRAIRDADRARTTARTGGEDKPFVGSGNAIATFSR